MYKLENDVEWTEGLRNAFKHGITRTKIIYEGTIITEDTGIVDVKIEDNRYVPDMGFIGQATAKRATITLKDTSGNWNFENQEFQLLIGADYENSTYYINYGNFIVNESPETDITAGTIKLIAFDYMLRFNKDYVDSITYPCTMKQLLENICTQANVELGTTSFANDDFIVEDNQFEGKTLREVLQNIAKSAFSWARIGQDNKLYLDLEVFKTNPELSVMFGNTSQEGTPTPSTPIDVEVVTGYNKVVVSNKNLYKGFNYTRTNNGITFEYREDGKIYLNGTATSGAFSLQASVATSNGYYQTLQAGTYTISSGYNNVIILQAYNTAGTQLATTAGTATTAQFTLTSQTNVYLRVYVNSGTTANNLTLNLQIEKGNQATDYIQHQEQSYEINLGKNLANISSFTTMTSNGITATNNNGIITANGTATANSFIPFNTTTTHFMLKAGTYTLSLNNTKTVSSTTTYVRLVNDTNNEITGTQARLITLNATKTFTLASDMFVRLQLRVNSGDTLDNIEMKIQLEKGSTQTPYAPYFEPIELCKIGNYQDRIYRQNGNWYLHKEVGKVVLDGTENWSITNTGTPNWYYSRIDNTINIINDSTINNSICDYYPFGSVGNSNTNQGYYIVKSAKQIRIRYGTEDTISNFKNWLSSNNVTLYYVLSTATDTEITNQALISQLEELYNLSLYEGANYVTLISNDINATYEFTLPKGTLEVEDGTEIIKEDLDDLIFSEIITIDEYEKDGFKKANEYVGGINTVVYAQSNIQGQEEMIQDTADVEINGVKQLVIKDNYFAYTTEKRRTLVQAGTKLFGLKYMPMQQLKAIGFAYLDCTDFIKVEDIDENNYFSIPFNHTIKYNGVLYDSFASESSSTNEQLYENKNSNVINSAQMEVIVDRALQQIRALITTTNETIQTISELLIEVGGISADVEAIVDLDRNKTATDEIQISETQTGSGFIVLFSIRGNTTYWTETDITLNVSRYSRNETAIVLETEDNNYLVSEDNKYIGAEDISSLLIQTILITLDDVLRSLTVEGITYYDELQILQDGTIQVIRRIGNNAGTLYLLSEEEITILEQRAILQTRYDNGYYYYIDELKNLTYEATYIIKNNYTDIYAMRAELNAGLELKVDTENLVSELNASADIIRLIGERLIIQMQNFSLDETGYMIANSGTIGGFTINDTSLYNNKKSLLSDGEGIYVGTDGIALGNGTLFKLTNDANKNYEFSLADVDMLIDHLNGLITLPTEIQSLYDVNNDGSLTILDAVRMMRIINGDATPSNDTSYIADISIDVTKPKEVLKLMLDNNNELATRIGMNQIFAYELLGKKVFIGTYRTTSTSVFADGVAILPHTITIKNYTDQSHTTVITNTGITTPTVTQTSLESLKKNISKYNDNAIELVKNGDIYEYNFKDDNDTQKKHIGFVIGEKYNTPKEIISENGEGIDTYSMVSILWKAVQEQQEQIENLKVEINKLKGEK